MGNYQSINHPRVFAARRLLACVVAWGFSANHAASVRANAVSSCELEKIERYVFAYLPRFGEIVLSGGQHVFIGSAGSSTCCGTVHAFRPSPFGWTLDAVFGMNRGTTFAVAPAMDSSDVASVLIGAPSPNCDALTPCSEAALFSHDGVNWVVNHRFYPPEADQYVAFAEAVALTADYVFIGAPLADNTAGVNTGAVYIFRRDGEAWSFLSKLLPADVFTNRRFGERLGVQGDLLAVSDTRAACALGQACGAVYLFRRTGDHWTQEAILSPSDPMAGGRFGTTVVVDDGRIFVGHPGAGCVSGTQCGAVYVFERSGEAWQETDRLIAPDAGLGDGFGSAVAVAGDTIVIGSDGDDCAAGADCGSAYVFQFNDGQWHFQFKVTASDPAPSNRFGRSVAIHDRQLIAGEPFGGTDSGTGVVSVFALGDDCDADGLIDACDLALRIADDCNRNGRPDSCDIADGTSLDCAGNGVPDECEPDCQGNGVPDDCDLTQGASIDCNADLRPDECGVQHACHLNTWRSPNPWPEANFGRSLAVHDDRLIVGEACESFQNPDCLAGSAHVYRLERDAWVLEASLPVDPSVSAQDRFGWSADIEGDWAVVGAPTLHCQSAPSCGGVFIYHREAESWVLDRSFTYADIVGDDVRWIGQSVALHGDVLVVGSPYSDCPDSSAPCGAVYLLKRINEVWTFQQRIQAPSPAPHSWFGTSVEIDGNVIVVGAPRDPYSNRGAAFVYRYDGASWAFEAELSRPFDFPRGLGRALAIDQDFIFLGAPGNITTNDDYAYRGAVLGYQRVGGHWTEAFLIEPPLTAETDLFGHVVALSPDWLAIGGLMEPCITDTECSAVYLFRRGPFGPQFHSRVTPPAGGSFRHTIALAEDRLLSGFPWANCASGLACGAVYHLALQGADCNCNRQIDVCEIAGGENDGNENQILDRCEADLDQDLDVDLRDFALFAQCFTAALEPAVAECMRMDFVTNQFIDLDDYRLLAGVWVGPGED